MRSLPFLLLLAVLSAIPLALADGLPAFTSPDGGTSVVSPAITPAVGPSPAIYPPQELPIRFDHAKHVGDLGLACVSCHAGATTSTNVRDTLLPQPTQCDRCHGTNHSSLSAVTSGKDANGSCTFCHTETVSSGRVAAVVMPRANLIFNHKAHSDRNIGCRQCHANVEHETLATRDDLPTMPTCTRCHQDTDSAARGSAHGECATCHIAGEADEGGRMKTKFASGVLTPPKWLGNAEHGPDFMERHKWVAANDGALCANCHSENSCAECHDGRVRPRNIHPNDFLEMHPVEARRSMERCTSCHREQSFCLSCHQRLGITMTGPSDVHSGTRFHPPKSIWSDPPMNPGHHGFEAERNIESCVSCHVERDCVVCHGGGGIGGGFNPHPPSFAGGCARQFRMNPRPCLVCHLPSDAVLSGCK